MTGTTLVGIVSGTGVETVSAAYAPGSPDELFVVDRRGNIWILSLTTGNVAPSPFLGIQSQVDDSEGEQGLLGLAFDPDYESNGYLYVNYTYDPSGPGLDRTRIDRFQVSNPLTDVSVNLGTQTIVLEFEQDFTNNNGGWIGFGPNDGVLYIATGDGGAAASCIGEKTPRWMDATSSVIRSRLDSGPSTRPTRTAPWRTSTRS